MNKELEALKVLGRIKKFPSGEMVYSTKEYQILETALKRLEVYDKCNYQTTIHKDVLQISKELKALAIIKEKDVDVGWLKRAKDLHEYNNGMGINSYSALTQEEYDLLKEVLLCGL